MTAAEIERDLLSRIGHCAPRDRVAIRQASALAKRLADLDDDMRSNGCDGDMVALHRQLFNYFAEALCRIGPDRVCNSHAGAILAQVCVTAQAIFEALPAAGCA